MTKEIKIGNVIIGGNNPIAIQSMTNTKTKDVESTVRQILRLEDAGCEIVRLAVPDIESARAIEKIKKQIHIPLVADIHFDYKLAIEAMNYGADKIRINPGNIGSDDKILAVVKVANKKNIPIRVGVNSGSLEKEILNKYKGVTAEGIVESALNKVELLEKFDFTNIVVAIKGSSVPVTIAAHKLLVEKINYPIHIGITESGSLFSGTVKSSVGIGILLSLGIGDTMRVSLTGDPVEEIRVAKKILSSLEIRNFGINLISCPTCGRTEVDLSQLVSRIEPKLENLDSDVTVAIMGCAVNGPGEAKEADLGIAGGKGEYLLFKKGIVIGKFSDEDIENVLLREIELITSNN